MGFQFKDHHGRWANYDAESDQALKMAFMSGHPTCMTMRGRHHYEIDFINLTQRNLSTGQIRSIRIPHSFKGQRPQVPLIPSGPTMMVRIPDGAMPGNVMAVAHPSGTGTFEVLLPEGAAPGRVMMVPVPNEADMMAAGGASAGPPAMSMGALQSAGTRDTRAATPSFSPYTAPSAPPAPTAPPAPFAPTPQCVPTPQFAPSQYPQSQFADEPLVYGRAVSSPQAYSAGGTGGPPSPPPPASPGRNGATHAPPVNVRNGAPTHVAADAVHNSPPRKVGKNDAKKQGLSTGAKVGLGTAGVVGAGAVTGAILADQGYFDADDVGDFFVDAGEGIGDAATDVGHSVINLF